MYNMHKKCLVIKDITVTLCDTSKMYNMHKKCIVGYYCDV